MAEQDDKDLLELAKERFEACEEYYSSEYARGEDDALFAMGDQWHVGIKEEREREGRPCLTENRMLPFIDQLVNSAREMRPAVKISPVDQEGDQDVAELFKGVVRNIERQSKADNAYDAGMLNSVMSGYGWILLRTQYCSEDSFDMEAVIDRVLNWQSVYLDPGSNTRDGSDAEYGFIYDDIPLSQFEEEYPDAEPGDTDAAGSFTWRTEETVRIVDYYYKEYKDVKIYRTPQGIIDEGVKALIDEQVEFGVVPPVEVLEEREVRVPQVKFIKFTGEEILEETDWLGKFIPIVPVYGKEVWRDGRRQSYSLIHQAKDPQRMFNYWRTSSTEVVALQPKAPFIGSVGQFRTHRNKWSTANRKNHAFLEFDLIDHNGVPVPPPQRQQPAMPSAGMLQEAALAAEGISASLGMYEEGRGQETNAISGVAIQSRMLRGDKATYHFLDNLAASIRHVGVILVDLIPKLYDEAKVIRILGFDGEAENVPVNQPFVTNEQGQKVPAKTSKYEGFYDLKAGKYDVDVDVGKSYANKRQETVDFITTVAERDPRILEIAGDLLFMAMDSPYSDEIAERLKATMDPAILGDDPQAAKLQAASQAMQQMQERLETLHAALQDKDKNEEAELALKAKELQIKNETAQADIAKTYAEIQQMMAETQGNPEQITDIATALIQLKEQVDDIALATEIQLDAEEVRQAGEQPPMEGLMPELNPEMEQSENE